MTENLTKEISRLRINLLRIMYFLTFVSAGVIGLINLINPKDLNPIYGIAFSFWFAYGILCLLGLINPIKMLPILVLQILYKITWMIGICIPLFIRGAIIEAIPKGHLMKTMVLVYVFAFIIIYDFIVIPWPYFFKIYLAKKD